MITQNRKQFLEAQLAKNKDMYEQIKDDPFMSINMGEHIKERC